jgi:hypothetical protein
MIAALPKPDVNPCAAADQVPSGASPRYAPKPDDFIVIDGNKGRIWVETS